MALLYGFSLRLYFICFRDGFSMKTKIITILIFTALILTACGDCGSSTTFTGATRMSTNNLFTVTLTENLHNKDVTAE